MKFAAALLSAANAVSLRTSKSINLDANPYDNPAYYYGSYGGLNNGFVDDLYHPTPVAVGPPGSYNPAYGGYIYVDFPETDYDTQSERDSPSNSYDSNSDYWFSDNDSYVRASGHSSDSEYSQYIYTHHDSFDNSVNNHSLSHDSFSDFDPNSESGYSHHGARKCVRLDQVYNPADDSQIETLYDCFYTDSDDGHYYSDSASSDSSLGLRGGDRDSDSDSDDTNTTDNGSLGSPFDYSYDSYGSDYY